MYKDILLALIDILAWLDETKFFWLIYTSIN